MRERDRVKRKAGLMGAVARGRKVTKTQRSDIMREVASHPRPSRVNPDRFPCGS
jgi:hypothetical protein